MNDRLCQDACHIVKSYSKDVRLICTSGRSLKNTLVMLSFFKSVCREEQRRQLVQKKRGEPAECRACDAGLSNGDCLSKNVVYSMCCSVLGGEYVRETERPLLVRFQEHFLQAKSGAVRLPWGQHFRQNHHNVLPVTTKEVRPFINVRILDKTTILS